MKEFDPTIDAVFREYADLELRRHHLLSAGRDNSAEIVEAEERMDTLWPKLDEVQRRNLKSMASDLNWVRRKGEPPPKGRKTAGEVSEQDQQELSAAIRSREWHRILHYLRLCAPAFQAASLARERGIAYEAVGLPGYARVFRDSVVAFTRHITIEQRAIILPNRVSAADAQALVSAPKDSVLVWEANGVKVAARTAGEERLDRAIEYKACA
jgi:hypothetical protein